MFQITRIQAFAFRVPLDTPVATSFGIMTDRPAVLIRIEDAEGGFGFGEVFANWPAAGAEHRARLLERDIAALVLGKNYKTPDALYHALSQQTRIRAVQCGEEGPFAQVIAGLDTALWDLAARRAGLPLRRLLNPNAPDTVGAYASGIHIAAATDIVPRQRALGHQAFKVKVGFDMEQDIAALQDLAASLAPHEQLACDANQAWTRDQAQTFINHLGDINLMWLEEPMAVFTEAPAWRRLADGSGVALAGGENLLGEAAFAQAIQDGCLGVIQPDVAKWGGVTGCTAVAQQALSQGRRYCPHFLGAGVGLTASAEILAAAGGNGLLEVDVNPNPLRSAFFEGEEPISDGHWSCTLLPGLGISAIPAELQPTMTATVDLQT